MGPRAARYWMGPAALLGLAACASFQPPVTPGRPGVAMSLPRPMPAVPSDSNFVLSVSEAVAGPEEDTPAYAKVYIDGKPAGETPKGPKSQEKKWGAHLSPGNHLFRFEYWVLPGAGDWGLLDDQWQPTERFIRIEEGGRTAVPLKFYEGGRKHSLQTSREPLR